MLSLADVAKSYGGPDREVPVLRGVSFELGRGSFCAIQGPSGSGKSTLLNIVGLLDRPTSGRMSVDGQAIDLRSGQEAARLRNQILGFIFQSFQLLPRLTAWENVALPLLYRGVPRRTRRPLALAMLEQVGLSSHAHHRPSELSGGQRQRVAIARALIGEPKLLLADEPTGSLDSVTATEIFALLREINARLDVTILMVTHDQELASRCDRRIEILDGQIVRDVVT